LWFQPRASIVPFDRSAEAKDQDEARLCREVGAGRMTTAQAVHRLKARWRMF